VNKNWAWLFATGPLICLNYDLNDFMIGYDFIIQLPVECNPS